jgi:two-component system, chemotaxis family, response regulator Rcp1
MFLDARRKTATGSTRPSNPQLGVLPRPPRPRECVRILLVEDNPGDVALVQRALRTWKTPTTLAVAGTGELAIELLRRERPLPSLALLDLNLPGRAGYEVLAEIKLDPELRALPVIVLSGSNDPGEAQRSYRAFANAFIQKTEDFTQFAMAMRALEDFWIRSV